MDWIKARTEVWVPIAGAPLFLLLLSNGRQAPPMGWVVLAAALALGYIAIVVWSPMRLPSKTPRPLTRTQLVWVTAIITVTVIGSLVLLTVLQAVFGQQPVGSRVPLLNNLLTFGLIIALGIAGVNAESRLTVDLFPEIRRREFRRLLYAVVAALYLVIIIQVWNSLFGGLAVAVGKAAGELAGSSNSVSAFDASHPGYLFMSFLIGAGLFEEIPFRLGIMTVVWQITGRWGWGLLASAVVFGLYHISPINSMAVYNLQAPVTNVLISLGTGLALGVLYRYRGLPAAVLVHSVGNWLLVLMMAGAAR